MVLAEESPTYWLSNTGRDRLRPHPQPCVKPQRKRPRHLDTKSKSKKSALFSTPEPHELGWKFALKI